MKLTFVLSSFFVLEALLLLFLISNWFPEAKFDYLLLSFSFTEIVNFNSMYICYLLFALS